ncbi:MAG: GDSL-type esterase/lipase family protein [Actinomycetota bacterium]|nr:GDSL-type esterase/lipase family protein [Actinomycetota bacterium]
MRRFRWHAAVLLLVITLIGGFFALSAPDPPPAPRPAVDSPRVLVAMGDSTISGEAAGDYEPGTDGEDGNWCHRSANASIHKTAVRGVEETINLACSGAPSAQVGLGDTEQYTESSQARRLREIVRTKRVVAVQVAVGANDEPGFSHVLDGCVQAWLDQGRPGCGAVEKDRWPGKVEAMVPKVVRALNDIRSVLREAGYQPEDYELVLQSYTAPVAPGMREELRNLNGCPVRIEDLQWIRESALPQINDGLHRAARETNARFLDLSRAGTGHEACANADPKQEWFSRLAVRWADLRADDRASHALQESFHPNAAGHAQFGGCLGEFLATNIRAAVCLAGPDGALHPAASVGP